MVNYKSIDISSVVQIKDWLILDAPLAGSRVKTTVTEIGAENLYVFKHPKSGREAQIWSELIASYIAGDLLKWPVQHTSIAMREDQIGNLLKYIYYVNIPSPSKETLSAPSEVFLTGEQLCKEVDTDFDPKQGKRHTWQLIRKIHDDFFAYDGKGNLRTELSEMYNQFWARAVVFDTLISNTDRHAENWALIFTEPDFIRMAPLYDNGSSMGCENTEQSLERKWFDKNEQIIVSKVQDYAAKGCHNLRDIDCRFKFEDLAIKVLKGFPTMRSDYEAVANLGSGPINFMDSQAS